MLLKDLVIYPPDDTYNVKLYNDSNFEFDTSILGSNFTITVRTYVDFFTYFTIKVDGKLLCLNNLARLGVNFCYAPITTINNNRHVFFLMSIDPSVTTVHHSYFEKSIFLLYYQTNYYNVFTQI